MQRKATTRFDSSASIIRERSILVCRPATVQLAPEGGVGSGPLGDWAGTLPDRSWINVRQHPDGLLKADVRICRAGGSQHPLTFGELSRAMRHRRRRAAALQMRM
jgi:hypothetical protein